MTKNHSPKHHAYADRHPLEEVTTHVKTTGLGAETINFISLYPQKAT